MSPAVSSVAGCFFMGDNRGIIPGSVMNAGTEVLRSLAIERGIEMFELKEEKDSMLTLEQVADYLTNTIAEDFLRADKLGLRRTQTTAGVLMAAGQALGDQETTHKFRLIAAQAANKQEELDEER
jgi:hypothetical protein